VPVVNSLIAGNFFSGAAVLAGFYKNIRRLRGPAWKFRDANREDFKAEQGTFGSWQGMPREMSMDVDADMLMLPSPQSPECVMRLWRFCRQPQCRAKRTG
jgi:hypothetical protein